MGLSSSGARFALLLAAILLAILVLLRPQHSGDVAEYSLTTIALATHGTPDIRLDDIATGRRLMPALSGPYDELEAGMRAQRPVLYAAFTRGREGKVYAIHFFGYSALAVLPYKLLGAVGASPMKCYQAVNLAAIFVLGLALLRLFGSARKALLGLGLFMFSGGLLYCGWSSPECVSAAGLLAGLALFASGAPIAGGVLAGLAAQQNPTIVFFFGFAPLLRLALLWRPGSGWRQHLALALQKRQLAGLAAGLALFALPLAFNLWQFGVPNIIAKLYSDPALIGLVRLVSFYFDLNQGMLIGIPGVLAALALWHWRGHPGARRQALVLAICAAFTLALAVPALAVLNWNSGAAGVMRYAFWAAMPLLFALFLRLRQQARWPLPLLAGVGLLQVAAMAHALSYGYTELSPLARTVLRIAPAYYHPEPEIFAERTGHHDDYIRPNQIYVHSVDGQPVTTLYNTTEPGIDERLCGEGGAPSAANRGAATSRGWRYVHGAVRCEAGGRQQRSFQLAQFKSGALTLAPGWSSPESNGGEWNGVWSDGPRSRIVIALDAGAAPQSLRIGGHYFEGNHRTRIKVNGVDLGWQALNQAPLLALAGVTGDSLQIELEHEHPHSPVQGGDPRALAFFLRTITLR